MRVTGRQLGMAIAERTDGLESLPDVDFVSSTVAELDATFQSRLPRLDERLRRQGKWANGDTVDLNYCRPSIGRGRDVVWRVVIEAEAMKVQVATGEFGRGVIEYVQQTLGDKLNVVVSLCACAAHAQKSLRVLLNDAILPLDELSRSLHESPAAKLEGSAFHFFAEASVRLMDDDVPDVAAWGATAIETLTPIYLAITPPMSLFIAGLPEREEAEYPEGAVCYRIHRARERIPAVIAEAKARFWSQHGGRLFCEVCGFDFLGTYGERGRDFAEGHHIRPVSSMAPGEVTKVSDICIVCSNCHSMLHRPPLTTPDELRRILAARAEPPRCRLDGSPGQ